MSSKSVYHPHNYFVYILLFLMLAGLAVLVFFGVIGFAFADVGFTPLMVVVILVATLVGSFINIPLLKLKTHVPIVEEESANFMELTYRIPRVHYGYAVTVIAVNVGGALIPTAVSIYLLSRAPFLTIIYSLVGVAVVALITRIVARPVKGVG